MQQVGVSGNNGPAAVLAHLLDHFGNRQEGEVTPQPHKHPDHQLLSSTEKIGNPVLPQHLSHLIRHPAPVAGPKALVDQFHKHNLVHGMGEKALKLPLNPPLFGHEQFIGPVLPPLCQNDCRLHNFIVDLNFHGSTVFKNRFSRLLSIR